MKKIIFAVAALLIVSLSGCADSSTSGADIDRRYRIALDTKNNHGVIIVSIPVTVEAESTLKAKQDTENKATVSPKTDAKIPLRSM